MQFLRARKYDLDKAFKTIEAQYLAKKWFPKLLDTTVEEMNRMMNLMNAGYFVPLSDRNAEGEKIVILRSKVLDLDVFKVEDAIRLIIFGTCILLEEEETQIAGTVFITDFSGATLNHLLNPENGRDFYEFYENCASNRQKKFYFLNLPTFANFIIDLVKSVVGKKHESRIGVVKTSEDLKTFIDLSLLPNEYGGIKPIDEMLDEFKQLYEKSRDDLQKFFDFKIDYEKVAKEKPGFKDEEKIGSFRKLEID